MVVSLATGLMGLGLAMPTGLAFGYGYGYGVRQGYHAFSPSKNPKTREGYQSLNPIDGAHAAGALSAEERTRYSPVGAMTDGVEPIKQKTDLQAATTQSPDLIENRDASRTITRAEKNQMSREEFRRWYYKTSYTSRRTSR